MPEELGTCEQRGNRKRSNVVIVFLSPRPAPKPDIVQQIIDTGLPDWEWMHWFGLDFNLAHGQRAKQLREEIEDALAGAHEDWFGTEDYDFLDSLIDVCLRYPRSFIRTAASELAAVVGQEPW